MEEFISTKISEIGKVITGKTPPTMNRENYGGEYLFISPNELHDGYKIETAEKTITEAGINSIKNNIIEGISVLVGCIGWDMGNVAMVHQKCATNQQINAITNFNDKYDPYYVYYWLTQKKDYLFSIASVTRTPILSKSTFEDIEIPIPSKAKQIKISHVLKKIDDKIQTNKKINDNLWHQAQLLYNHWFVDITGVKSYLDSNYIKKHSINLPLGWTLMTVSDAFDVCYGFPFNANLFLSTSSEETKPLVRIRDIPSANTDTYTSEVTDEKYALRCSDLLIGMDGNFHMNLWPINGALLNQRCIRIRKTEYPVLIAYFSTMPFIKSREKNVSRTTVGHLSATDINDLVILVPPEKIAKMVLPAFDNIADTICQNQLANQELISLRDWLLPMLMNGQATIED